METPADDVPAWARPPPQPEVRIPLPPRKDSVEESEAADHKSEAAEAAVAAEQKVETTAATEVTTTVAAPAPTKGGYRIKKRSNSSFVAEEPPPSSDGDRTGNVPDEGLKPIKPAAVQPEGACDSTAAGESAAGAPAAADEGPPAAADTRAEGTLTAEDMPRAKRTKSGPGKIPTGWLESTTGGSAIHGICPVKTPLTEAYNLPANAARWTPADCIEACGGDRVRLLIDLTASQRYYSPNELPASVEFHKVQVAGHGVPNEHQVASILGHIGDMRVTHGDSAVAVIHCTHGLNRTGVCTLPLHTVSRASPRSQPHRCMRARARPFPCVDARLHRLFSRSASRPGQPALAVARHRLRGRARPH